MLLSIEREKEEPEAALARERRLRGAEVQASLIAATICRCLMEA